MRQVRMLFLEEGSNERRVDDDVGRRLCPDGHSWW
jgi:hypothetical protein